MIIWMTRISTALNRELDPEDEQVEAFSHLILVRGGHRRRKTGSLAPYDSERIAACGAACGFWGRRIVAERSVSPNVVDVPRLVLTQQVQAWRCAPNSRLDIGLMAQEHAGRLRAGQVPSGQAEGVHPGCDQRIPL